MSNELHAQDAAWNYQVGELAAAFGLGVNFLLGAASAYTITLDGLLADPYSRGEAALIDTLNRYNDAPGCQRSELASAPPARGVR